MSPRGLPHSDIPGSKLVCSSPGLIAAYRVLHRLLAPRHSPYALSSLTTSVFELTLAGTRDPGPGIRRSPARTIRPTRDNSISSHTLRVFEKNYRLQDIQLSKNPPSLPSATSARQARVLRTHQLVRLNRPWLAEPSFSARPPSRDPHRQPFRPAEPSLVAGLPSRSPPTLSLRRAKAGGEYRARTGDLLVANQALSQLS